MARILIIDDSVTVATMLKRLFERKGHEVFAESDPQAGLAPAREQRPALKDCGLARIADVASGILAQRIADVVVRK